MLENKSKEKLKNLDYKGQLKPIEGQRNIYQVKNIINLDELKIF